VCRKYSIAGQRGVCAASWAPFCAARIYWQILQLPSRNFRKSGRYSICEMRWQQSWTWRNVALTVFTGESSDYPVDIFESRIATLFAKWDDNRVWSNPPPPPGGGSYSRTWYKSFEGGPLTHGSWWGNIVNRKPPRGGGVLSIKLPLEECCAGRIYWQILQLPSRHFRKSDRYSNCWIRWQIRWWIK